MDSNYKVRLKAAYRQLLRPLVRILLRNEIKAAEFMEIAKLVYVDVAQEAIEKEGRSASKTALAGATGLSGREIELVIARQDQGTGEDSNLNQIMKVLSGWHTDADYTGPYGLPLELSFKNERTPNFCALSERYAPDAKPAELLSELLRIGAVKETDDSWFKVLTRTYLPKLDDPASLEHLAQSVENFANTIDHNRTEIDPDKKLFERVVEADDGIRKEDLPRFKEFVRDRGQLLLEEIDNWLSQLDPPKDGSESRTISTGLGIYHYVEKE